MAFIFFLGEAGKLQEDETELVGEHFVRIPVGQDDVRAEFAGRVGQVEIHEEDAIHGFQVEFPFGTPFPLPGDGLREVVQSPFTEKGLFTVLHFHDELFTVFIRTIYVIDDAPVAGKVRQQLFVQECDVRYPLFSY